MKVSIIIPIYNVEKYLSKCLDSVITSVANNNNIEILLIDDGSTDNSSKIIEQYRKNNSNISVYYKNNGGLSDARNYGLLRAKGEYVVFIDSDDEINSELFKKIINKIENSKCDVLIWDACLIDENSKLINSDENEYFLHHGVICNKIYSGIEFIETQLRNKNDFATTVWLGAYRKDFLLENQLMFEKGLLHEDEMWSIKLFIVAKKIEYFDEKVYLYRQRYDSIMNKKNKEFKKNIKDIIYIYSSLYAYISWKIVDKEISKMINGNISRRYIHALGKFDAYKYKQELKIININQLINNSTRFIDKIRGVIFKFSPYIYCKLTKK